MQDRSSTTIRLLLKAGSRNSCHWLDVIGNICRIWGWVKTPDTIWVCGMHIDLAAILVFTMVPGFWGTANCWWKNMSERLLESPNWNSTVLDMTCRNLYTIVQANGILCIHNTHTHIHIYIYTYVYIDISSLKLETSRNLSGYWEGQMSILPRIGCRTSWWVLLLPSF